MTKEEIRAMHQNHTRSETYVAQMKKVLDQAIFRLGASVVSNRAFILPALLADEVALDATPAEPSKTYQACTCMPFHDKQQSFPSYRCSSFVRMPLCCLRKRLSGTTTTQEQKEKVLLLRMSESANHNHASPGEIKEKCKNTDPLQLVGLKFLWE